MTVQWIEETCPSPVMPSAAPIARAYYGSGVMPVTTRPPWLHDSGGVAPGIIAGNGGDGALGQPYKNELWVWTLQDASGNVLGVSGVDVLTHVAGIAKLKYMAAHSAGGGIRVCGSYMRTGVLAAPYTVCSADGVTTLAGSLPPWLANCVVKALSTLGGPDAQAAVLNSCVSSYSSTVYPSAPKTVFISIPQLAKTFPFPPEAAILTTPTGTLPVPPLYPVTPPTVFPFRATFMAGPRWLGQACEDVKATIANLQNAKNGLQQALGPVNQAYNDAVASGNAEAINAANAARQDLLFKIGDVDSKLVAAQAALTACQTGGGQPVPTGGCTDDSNCPSGFSCIDGNCILTGCRNDGDCGTFKCVKANPNDEFGTCQPPPPVKAGIGGGWALALLALAAVGAIFFGARPGGMPSEESLQSNPHRYVVWAKTSRGWERASKNLSSLSAAKRNEASLSRAFPGTETQIRTVEEGHP